MKRQFLASGVLLVVLVVVAACVPVPAATPQPAGQGIANPASENCVKQGGTLEIRKGAGGEVGYCKFADGSECEEWALMRGECKPKSAAAFTDPFAYCAAVGTVDKPDARYTGPKTPDSVVKGVRKALNTPADASNQPFVDGTSWRCADGKVMACFIGANLPCETKADTSKTPNAGIVDFCKANPAAEVVPAAAAGRATVYSWRCKSGAPEIVKQIFNPDAQGFIKEIYYEIAKP
jgi:putative hemolysin